MDFDGSYASTPALFGESPDALLVDHVHRLDPSRPVLDIGAGQGRNALFLARRGLAVHAIDPSEPAIAQLRLAAADEGLDLRADALSFDAVRAPSGGCGAVLVFGLVPILDRAGVDSLVACVSELTAPGGHAFVTCFTTHDPRYVERSRSWTRGAGGTLLSPAGAPWTYLEPGELPALFESFFDVAHHRQGLGPWHRHGAGEPERHGVAEVVLRRR